MDMTPCPPDFNLARYVLAAGASTPEKVALAIVGTSSSERWSYRRLRDKTYSVAAALRAAGLRSGDRLLLRIGNEPSFAAVFLGAAAIGAIPVPTAAALTQPEITRLADDLSPTAILAAPGIELPVHHAPVLDVAMLTGTPIPDRLEFHGAGPDAPGFIVYTSGTSGEPRGVVHAHRAIHARQSMVNGWYGITTADRMLHAGAFNWTFTLGTGLLDPWTAGATALIPEPGTPPEAIPLLLKRYDATLFAAAPGVYRQILKQDLLPMPKLRHGLSAGEKLAENIRTNWQEATGTPLHEAFGMSECSTFISGSPSCPAPSGTLGFAQKGRRVSIRANGGDAAIGEEGTIAIHRDDPGLMLGYLNAPQLTQQRFDGDWFLTGDRACQSPDGAITYLGRKDDIINAGGFRISPVEIEDALTSHPAVAEAAACELRVKSDATVVGAFWTHEPSEDKPSESALNSHLSARLAVFKRPRVLAEVDTLPRGANNKLLRQDLRRNWERRNGQP